MIPFGCFFLCVSIGLIVSSIEIRIGQIYELVVLPSSPMKISLLNLSSLHSILYIKCISSGSVHIKESNSSKSPYSNEYIIHSPNQIYYLYNKKKSSSVKVVVFHTPVINILQDSPVLFNISQKFLFLKMREISNGSMSLNFSIKNISYVNLFKIRLLLYFYGLRDKSSSGNYYVTNSFGNYEKVFDVSPYEPHSSILGNGCFHFESSQKFEVSMNPPQSILVFLDFSNSFEKPGFNIKNSLKKLIGITYSFEKQEEEGLDPVFSIFWIFGYISIILFSNCCYFVFLYGFLCCCVCWFRCSRNLYTGTCPCPECYPYFFIKENFMSKKWHIFLSFVERCFCIQKRSSQQRQRQQGGSEEEENRIEVRFQIFAIGVNMRNMFNPETSSSNVGNPENVSKQEKEPNLVLREPNEEEYRRRREVLTEDEICVICLDMKKARKFLPCNHICSCGRCSDLVMKSSKTCPLCRAEIKAVENQIEIIENAEKLGNVV